MRKCLAVLLLLPAPALAQPAPTGPYEAEFTSCIADAAALDVCVGEAAGACMMAEEGGQSTFGMSACLGMEAQLWSFEIAREFFRATRDLRARDAEHREFFGEQFSGAAEALAASQATWRAWAEAECSLVYAEAGSGSVRYLDAGSCTIDIYADRLERLRRIGEEYER